MVALILKGLIALFGLLHAAAAYAYFSKDGRAWPWTAAWLSLTALCVALFSRAPLSTLVILVAAICAWTWWWESLHASFERSWVVENARQATAQTVEDELIIRDLRNFEWLSAHDFVPRWEARRYPLGKLSAVDLFVCTWGDPRVAHLIVSFVFGDLPPLAFSIETRRETTEHWSMLAGFMRSYELLVIAADERDVVRVRSNVRGERVARYRLKSTPQMRRKLLGLYVDEMNDLVPHPRFYNTLLRNCTTEVIRILRASGRQLPVDWRILVSGHVPRYLYELGLLEDQRPFAEVVSAADIVSAARAADDAPDFWRRIREVHPHVAPG